MANGYANRFLFLSVRRSKLLPFGGALDPEVIRDLGIRLKTRFDAARNISEVTMTDVAREEWRQAYETLSKGEPGLLGAILGRAEAQVIRLALIHALIDRCAQIDLCHLEAATAFWKYCDGSARHIFGDSLGDPMADTILRELRKAGPAGLTRLEIGDIFKQHQSRNRVDQALSTLRRSGRARMMSRPTGGRPAEVWVSVRSAWA